MKNINAIKEEIISVIKPNDNEEITGQVLQDVLVNTVDSLGAAFDEQIKEGAEVGAETKIGTSAIIGENTMLGTGTKIGTGCYIGSGVKIQPNFVIGAPNININAESTLNVGTKFSIAAGSYRAEVGYGVSIGQNAKIGAYISIGQNAKIGAYISIGQNANIGQNADIGQNANIGAYISIGQNTNIGDNTSISSGVVIGSDVHIGDYVEIGSNVSIGTNNKSVYISGGITISHDSSGVTIRTDYGQVKLNYN